MFGAPDPEWGERVCAAVVADTNVEVLKGWLHNRIVGPHRPKDLVVVETLPRTATGKIDRERLRSALGERTV